MIELNPAQFSTYKAFILALEAHSKVIARGFRRKLAEAMDCQPAFVSQVLNGSGQLSLEQGYRAAEHFGLRKNLRRYFMLLLEKERAGTRELRAYFDQELDALRPSLLNFKTAESQEISADAQSTYYRHWTYAAIHMLITIPRYRTPQAIAAALALPEEEARKAIEFLLRVGLIKMEGERLLPGLGQLHLSQESSWIENHHTQWRLRAIDRLHHGRAGDMHYSTVSSLSRQDFQSLKAKIVEWVRDYRAVVKDSAEEELCAFSVDFYQIT